MKKVVLASGFFDPIHIGHIEYLKKSKELGDYLVVVVNTDHAAKLKKGYSFMCESERIQIIKSIKYVDEVYLANDFDGTVSESLRQIKPNIFAKGGDRNETNIPISELKVCQELGIKLVTGLGMKVQSSSLLLEKYLIETKNQKI